MGRRVQHEDRHDHGARVRAEIVSRPSDTARPGCPTRDPLARRLLLTAVTGLVGLVITAVYPLPAVEAAGAASFNDVREIGELRNLFNADEGTTRLILLLSPT